jgi:hypothetical protein
MSPMGKQPSRPRMTPNESGPNVKLGQWQRHILPPLLGGGRAGADGRPGDGGRGPGCAVSDRPAGPAGMIGRWAP